jgi:FKBP-type peptidyl-prolyl cis-trans isomerase FkpA
MRNVYLVLCAVAIWVFSASCNSGETLGCTFNAGSTVAPATEVASIETYIASQGLTGYTKADGGFYYKIEIAGDSKKPSLCDRTTVAYEGKLTNGNKFDNSNSASFQIGATIEGWKRGMPLIGKGGKIKLIIPPSLGYGDQSVPDRNGGISIPANSILLFEVSILDIQ